jgi:hypothetical protein
MIKKEKEDYPKKSYQKIYTHLSNILTEKYGKTMTCHIIKNWYTKPNILFEFEFAELDITYEDFLKLKK